MMPGFYLSPLTPPSQPARGRKIGILGGSFNPAHEGHVHISLLALQYLGLDEVWWLVSPQNPLKSAEDMAAFEARLDSALGWAMADKRIIVTDIEAQWRTRYTFDSLRKLHKRYSSTQFVWLMGADNLAGFHRWQHWRQIVKYVPIAVFDRAPHSHRSLRSPAASLLAKNRQYAQQFKAMASTAAPAFAFLSLELHPMSASFLRKTLGKSAFLRHNDRMK